MSQLPQAQAVNNAQISGGGSHSPLHGKFLIPSPVPSRRNRTYSQSKKVEDLAKEQTTYKGKVIEFCRSKGHGFVRNEEENETLFVHISDIEGEFVPKPGDDVTYKLIPLPLNPQKRQAVHVKITHLAPGVSHETWNSPNTSPNISPRT